MRFSSRPPRRRSATSGARCCTQPFRPTVASLRMSGSALAYPMAHSGFPSASKTPTMSSVTSRTPSPASSERPNALVFNCHITGLSVARSLAAHGVRVISLDPDPRGLGQASRAVAARYSCPNPLEDERAFVDFLLARADDLGEGAVLFPTNDE